MGVIDWVKDKFSGNSTEEPLTREVSDIISDVERQPEPEPVQESAPEPVSDFPEFTEDLTEKITGNSKQEKYKMPWTSDVKEPEEPIKPEVSTDIDWALSESKKSEGPPLFSEVLDSTFTDIDVREPIVKKPKKPSDNIDILPVIPEGRPNIFINADTNEIPNYGKPPRILNPSKFKTTKKQAIPVVDLTSLKPESEEAVRTEKEVGKKEETKFNFSNFMPTAGTIGTPDLVTPVVSPFDPTLEGAMRRGSITPEDTRLNLIKQGMSEDEATKKVKEITDDLAQKGGAEKLITLVDPLAKGPEVESVKPKRDVTGSINTILGVFGKRLPTKEELKARGKENILGASRDDEYYLRGKYTGPSRRESELDIISLTDDNKSLKDQLDQVNEEIRIETEKVNAAKDKWENFRGSRKEKDELLEDYNVFDRSLKGKISKRKLIIERMNENKKDIRERQKDILKYEQALVAAKLEKSRKSAIGKKLQNLGEGASMVTSGLYTGKMGTGDWFGPKGFMSQPFKRSSITQNVVTAPSVQNLSYITKSTGSKVGREMTEGITTIRADKRLEPMGMPGTVYGARARFDYGVPAQRISLIDASGGTLRRDIFVPQQPAYQQTSQQMPQQYKQVIQPDGTIVNVPVPAVANYRTPKSTITLVKRGVKSSAKPVEYHGMLKRGMNNVGSFKPVTFSSQMASSFRKVGKPPVVIRQRESKLLDVSVNRYPHGTALITNQPIGLDRFAKGFKSINIVNKSVKILPEVRKVFDLGLISVKDMDTNIYETGDVIKHGQLKDIEYTETPIRERDRKPKKSSPLVNMKSLLRVGKKMNKFLSKQKVRK